MAAIRVGIGGWDYAPWRGSFYPAGLPHARELEYAAERLTAIEINGTFYRTQSAASFATWRDAVPKGFVFAVKAHRAAAQGRAPAAAIGHFLRSGIAELGPKLGPILWQFPPARKFDEAGLEAFLALLPPTLDGLKLRHALEARHPSFASAEAVGRLRRAGVAQVIVDSEKQALSGDLTAGFVYARLQRNRAAEPEGYAAEGLDEWAGRFRAWRDGRAVADLALAAPPAKPAKRDVFAFFIAGDKEHAPTAAQAMLGRLAN